MLGKSYFRISMPCAPHPTAPSFVRVQIRQDLALDCSLCPDLHYPESGGVVADLKKTITLDGQVDGGNSLPDSLSGTFVLCLAKAADLSSTPPEAGVFKYYPHVSPYQLKQPAKP